MMLVAGATGLLGFEVCRQMRSAGHVVRALARPDSPRREELTRLGCEVAEGDLKDPDSLAAACRNASAVVTTANTATRRRPGDNLRTVDRDGQKALLAAARKAGARRFVYMSLSPGAPDCPFVRCKREVEAAVRESGMEWAILQPAAFLDVWLSPLVGWDLARGRARIVGDGDKSVSYVAAADVAAFTVIAASDPRMRNRALRLGGPEAISPLQVLRVCEEVAGRSFRVQRVPAGALRLASALLRVPAPILSSLLVLGVDAAEHGDAVDMESTRREFSVSLTSVREFVRSALSAA